MSYRERKVSSGGELGALEAGTGETGPRNEREGDWGQDSQKEESREQARFWTVGHGSFSEMA